jgi:RNase H-fold protein (predicted Holliday junction resolvase)
LRTVLAVDPGLDKCGIAVVTPEGTLHAEVVARNGCPEAVASLVTRHSPDEIVIGNGTGSDPLADEIRALAGSIPIALVDEAFSSEKARKRYLLDNPPKGIRRLIPLGLRTPDRPYDDYVAVILAEERLRASAG